MNGRIWVESEYKQGSTFNVELPRIDHEEATRLIESASMEQEHVDDPTPIATPLFAGTSIEQPDLTPTPPVQPIPTPIAPIEPIDTSEVVYTNSPVEMVVQQLQSINNTQQQPVIPPMPVAPQMPTPAVPQYQPPPTAPYTSPARPAAEHANIPLTSIEQNPAEYRRTRTDGVPIPPRNQN
jgi:hypothetical protein